ncbi:lactate dehydrogenase B [Chytriomyces sp. MP71]|nr:lactate dehydrogenase B [Chytriomyces sp. MP71]
MPSRIAIIGAGSVGATIAYACVLHKVCSEMLLVDVVAEAARGQVLDLSDAAFLSSVVVREASFAEAGNADVIVITAGAKQRPDESRQSLIDRNQHIMESVLSRMQPIQPNAILLIVANPVDILTVIAQRLSGLPKKQVFGSGTFLDSARLRLRLSQLLNVSETSVHTYVLGEHGDSQFVAWSTASVAGLPLLSFPAIQALDRDALEKEISRKAYEIIKLKGATYFGIGACVASICQCIFLNSRHVRPVSVWVDKYGVCLALPSVIGSRGIEQVMDVSLNESEQQKLETSVASLKAVVDSLAIEPVGLNASG